PPHQDAPPPLRHQLNRHPQSETSKRSAASGAQRAGKAMTLLAEARVALEPAVRIDHVSKVFGQGGQGVVALDRVTLDVGSGEFLCIVGASGCGKTTLLNLVAGLDCPTAGNISLDGARPAPLFQEPALLPWLSARPNHR